MTEEFIASTGVKFIIGDVPIMAFREVQKRLEKGRPHVPIVYIADKERDEENPNDPKYIDELKEWDDNSSMQLMDFALMTGTYLSEIPEGIEPIGSNGWVEECRYLGTEVPENGKLRYLQWIKYIACPRQEDIQGLILAAMRKIGVPEEDVAESASLFQGRAKRRTNPSAQD